MECYSNSGGSNVSINSGFAPRNILPEVDETYQSLLTVVKELDKKTKHITSISQLFQQDIKEKRSQLIQICKKLLFMDHQAFGKRALEYMWHKGHYTFITYIRNKWPKELTYTAQVNVPDNLAQIERLIRNGILNYKCLALQMEKAYNLDLKYLFDTSILSDAEIETEQFTNTDANNKSSEAVSFAVAAIHSFLLSLGDLHRYIFNFCIDSHLKVAKEQAAKYYLEAFKLKPSIGKSQNQLGNLYSGQNYDLDSIFHYLYSLVSIVPFQLSENNVCERFTTHVNYFKKLDPENAEFGLQDFYAKFYFMVDTFFFDREVPKFESICHCVLIDLKNVLSPKAFHLNETSILKIISILLFCVSKLKMINSPKVHLINAFLVAVCAILMDECMVNLEQTILAKTIENQKFHSMYENKFNGLVKAAHACKGNNSMTNRMLSSKSREKQRENGESVIKQQHVNRDCEGRTANRNVDPIWTHSRDEAKQNVLNTPMFCKQKVLQSDDSSSDSDMYDFVDEDEDNADFSSSFNTDFSSNYDTDFSDIEQIEEVHRESKRSRVHPSIESKNKKNEQSTKRPSTIVTMENPPLCSWYNENKEISDKNVINTDQQQLEIEKQYIDSREVDSAGFQVLRGNDGSNFSFKNTNNKDHENHERKPPNKKNSPADDVNANSVKPLKKLFSHHKYKKINPNIIVDFAINERSMKPLKILYDWLGINQELLVNCYQSNPEFLHKMMKLINYFNIDIYTRKTYFEREFLTTPNVRNSLSEIFDARVILPLAEDLTLKNFDILQSSQLTLDWKTAIRGHITPEEECILRLSKMVDFGFLICKKNMFPYCFCKKARNFVEKTEQKHENKNSMQGNANQKEVKYCKSCRCYHKSDIVNNKNTSSQEKDSEAEHKKSPKGYLRYRNSEKHIAISSNTNGGGGDSITNNSLCENILPSSNDADETHSEALANKCKIMGELWLKNEIEQLEEELRKNPFYDLMTPFLVVDVKALTQYHDIVKKLIRSVSFIVLIPTAILNELDRLKKQSKNARHVIRWLEQELTVGNRFLRIQQENEKLALHTIKLPGKLDRDANVFIQIAQFCNFMVVSYSDSKMNQFQGNIVTYLSGDSLYNKQLNQNSCSFTGILGSINVRYEQITSFYTKFMASTK